VTQNVTGSTRALSRFHQEQIIDALQRQGPLSRPQIGILTGLSPATVTRLVGSLVDLKLVVNADKASPSGSGRPAGLVALDPRAVVAASVDIGATVTTTGIVDWLGHAYDVQREDIDPNMEPGRRIQHSLDAATALLERAAAQKFRCRTLGVSVPGVVASGGHVVTAPSLDWRDVPLGDLVAARAGVPAAVENDAACLALAEHWWGHHRDSECLVAVALSWGIAARAVVGGQLFRGAHRMAGEIGHMLTDRSAMAQFFPRYGDLETRVGIDGITARARERGITGADGYMTAARVFDLADDGSQVARDLLDTILDDLAIAIGNVCVMMDPDVVVLGGGVGSHTASIIPGLQERLNGRIPHLPEFDGVSLGLDQWLIGAGTLALRQAGSPLDLV
jgi:predicted NBD/HSP70 family sugar kinase